MTAALQIQSLAPALNKRSEHRVGSDPGAQAALKRFGQGVRTKRGTRPQRLIAKRVGISIKQYSNIECGNNWPSVPVYRKLCQVLKIALPRLLK